VNLAGLFFIGQGSKILFLQKILNIRNIHNRLYQQKEMIGIIFVPLCLCGEYLNS